MEDQEQLLLLARLAGCCRRVAGKRHTGLEGFRLPGRLDDNGLGRGRGDRLLLGGLLRPRLLLGGLLRRRLLDSGHRRGRRDFLGDGLYGRWRGFLDWWL